MRTQAAGTTAPELINFGSPLTGGGTELDFETIVLIRSLAPGPAIPATSPRQLRVPATTRVDRRRTRAAVTG